MPAGRTTAAFEHPSLFSGVPRGEANFCSVGNEGGHLQDNPDFSTRPTQFKRRCKRHAREDTSRAATNARKARTRPSKLLPRAMHGRITKNTFESTVHSIACEARAPTLRRLQRRLPRTTSPHGHDLITVLRATHLRLSRGSTHY